MNKSTLGDGYGRRIWNVLVCILMVLMMAGLFSMAAQAAKNKATTIRLVRTEGNVTIKNSKREELVQTLDMRLYSGDHQITDSASYAWMSLDDSKAVKIDENSETELRKRWRKLEVLLDSGSVYFNVSVPLAQDEELNIRSSTMVTGIRGTCGWVRVMDGGDTRVYLLEGTLECVVTNPVEGGSETITLKPGQYADFYVRDPENAEESTEIVMGTFDKEDIEPYVLVELLEDDELIEKIYEQSGIDLRKKDGDLRKKLEEKQRATAVTKKGIRGRAAEQDGVVSKDPVWDDDGNGDRDSIIYLTMPQTATTVQKYLDMEKVRKVVLLPGEGDDDENTLKVDIAFRAPVGKVLESREGVFVDVESGRSFLVDGTAVLKDRTVNHGTLTVNSANTLVAYKVLENHGTLENTPTGRIVLAEGLISDGVFKTAGLIEAQEDVSGDTLITINGGSFAITGGKIVTSQFRTVLSVASGNAVTLDLGGGEISNDQDGGTTIRVGTENFQVKNMTTDVMGVTDTLLGEAVDLTEYEAATVWRTDARYHLIALSEVESYPVVVVKAAHGTISAPERVEVGATVPLAVRPDEGYELETLAVNLYDGSQTGASVGLSGNNSFVMPRSNVIVSGSFKEIGRSQEETTSDITEPDDVKTEKDYCVSVNQVLHGSVQVSKGRAKENDVVSVFVVPEVGYELQDITASTAGGSSVGIGARGNGYGFSMPADDVTVTVSFRVKQYTVTFYDMDGSTILQQQTMTYGTVPSYGGRTPSHASTAQYDYFFAGWKNAAGTTYRDGMPLPAVTGNESYVLQYNLNLRNYMVTFYDEDGITVLKQERFSYGSVPDFGTPVPTKTATPQYAYNFAGWRNGTKDYPVGTNLPTITGDASYTAYFDSIINVCDVIWKNEDGTVLETDDAVPYGSPAEYNGTLPTKTGDAQYSYSFDGWTDGTNTYHLTDPLPVVTQAVTFTAVFRQSVNTYMVTWKDDDGTVLETDADVPYGTIASYDGALPAKATDYNYSYTFDHWTDGSNAYTATMPQVEGNLTLTAVYLTTPIVHITGVSLDQATLPLVVGGTETGTLTASLAPANATYQGVTWSSSNDAVAEVIGNGLSATVTAKSNGTAVITVTTEDEGKTASCTVTVTTAVASVTLDKQTANVILGTTETLNATVLPAAASNKAVSWHSAVPGVATVAAGNVVGTAVITPVSAGMTQIQAITEDGGLVATCTVTVSGYAVTFRNDDANGTILDMQANVAKGAVPVYGGTNPPTKTATTQYDYVFDGWTDGMAQYRLDANGAVTLPAVMGNVTYTALYSVRKRVTGVTLDQSTITIPIKRIMATLPTATLAATVAPADASNLGVTWKSSDESVCTVQAGGQSANTATATVTALSAGTATITATTVADGKTATCVVTVTNAVESVALDKTKLLLTMGGADDTLTATIDPSNATNQNVTWTSDDDTIATVTGSGLTAMVHAVGNGTTNVTVTTQDGGLTASIPVTVTTAVTGVSFANATESIYLGTTGNILQVTIEPATASNKNVSWVSSDETVATITVDANDSTKATINPLKFGTTVLTVTTADGSKTDTCTVTVKGYEVSFVNYDGTSLLTNYYAYGDTPSYPTTLRYPERTRSNTHSYTFAGFSDGTKTYTYSLGAGLETFDPITTDTTYTAVYTEAPRVFRVTLDLNAPANAGTAGPSIAAGKEVTQYTYGTVTTLPDAANVTCPGYRFIGWYKSATPAGMDPAYTEISATDYGVQEFWAMWEKTYNATMPTNLSHGTITAVKNTLLAPGETVTLAVSPDITYELSYLYYAADEGGARTVIEKNADGIYSFEMPEYDVTISAAFNWLHDLYYSVDAATGTLILARHQAEDGSLTAMQGGELLFTNNTTITKLVFAEDVYPKKMDSAFEGCTNLTTVVNMDKVHLDENVTNISAMFKGCTNLQSLDLSGLDTSNVTDMSEMFSGCTNLTELDLSGFDTAQVTDMTQMFSDCYRLGTIYVSDSFVTDKVTASDNMFQYCGELTGGYGTRAEYMEGVKYTPIDATYARLDNESQEGYFTKKGEETSTVGIYYKIVKEDEDNIVMSIYANKADGLTKMLGGALYCFGIEYDDGQGNTIHTGEITKIKIMEEIAPNQMIYAFGDMNGLQSIEGLDKINTEKVTELSYVFNGCYDLGGSIDISSWNTQNATTMEDMFRSCGSLTSIKLPAGANTKLNNMGSMFCDCYSLESIDMSGFKTPNVEDMNSLFHGCGELASINLSEFTTSNVKDMSSMFSGCEKLTTIDVSKFDTSNVEDFMFMFADCKAVKTLPVSGFNTAKGTDFYGMFHSCYALESLDLSRWDTSSATELSAIFAGCFALKSVDLSNFNTSNVLSMGSMFYNCTSLTTLDLSSFDTSKVSYFGSMFYAENPDTKLTTIYVSNAFVTNDSLDYSVFTNRTALVGGAGSEYKPDRTSSEYAHIDGGEGAEGYFTAKSVASGTYQLSFIKNPADVDEIKINATVDGANLSSVSYVEPGKTVVFKAKEPYGYGYSVRNVHAAKKVGGEQVAVSYTGYEEANRNMCYSFVMPAADVTVNVEYAYFNTTYYIDEDQLSDIQDYLDGEYATLYLYYTCTLGTDFTIPAGKTLIFERDDTIVDQTVTIESGVTITIEEGATLENYCTLVNEGIIVVNGRFHNYCDHTLNNHGTILIGESGSLVNGDGMESGKDGRLCNFEDGVIRNSGLLINAYGSIVENDGTIINDHALQTIGEGYGSFIGNAELFEEAVEVTDDANSSETSEASDDDGAAGQAEDASDDENLTMESVETAEEELGDANDVAENLDIAASADGGDDSNGAGHQETPALKEEEFVLENPVQESDGE